MRILIPPNKRNNVIKPFYKLSSEDKCKVMDRIFKESESLGINIEYSSQELIKIRGRDL